MSVIVRRILFWAIPVAAVLAGLVFAFWPRPVEVDLAHVARGSLARSVSEEGQTRIREIFVVSAPVRGRALRVEAHVGDPVTANETTLAMIEPMDPEFLDVRTEEEARAAAAAAKSALAVAKAQYTQVQAELEFATSELARIRALAANGTVSKRVVEDTQRIFRTQEAALKTAEAAVEMSKFELEAAEARLLRPDQLQVRTDGCPCVPIVAPVDGRVLRVLHESEGVVVAGQPLVELGDPADLEIVVDFRSEDALQIKAGDKVNIDGWGGDRTLRGNVNRVEPFGFTKISALGIEEQRVNVIIDIDDPADTWPRLGHGFRVDAHVILWSSDFVLKLPLTALFRAGDRWQVFEVRTGIARITEVEVGQITDAEAEVLSGLDEGAAVIRYPDARIEDGTQVRSRR